MTLGAAVLSAAVALTNVTFQGDATWYVPGGSACGITSAPADLVAALPASMFAREHCGRQAAVWRGDRSVIVTITDRCAGCRHGSIDLGREAFARIARLGEGRITVRWFYLEDDATTEGETEPRTDRQSKLTAYAPGPLGTLGGEKSPAQQKLHRA